MNGGYRATRGADGVLTIHSVPIFVECTRGDFCADAAWIDAAVAKAKASELEGYLPPLHIRHHGEKSGADVRAAGFFRIRGTERIEFRGAVRLAVIADLVVTDPLVQSDIIAKRLPYRSVEIFNAKTPSIDSLALLDHEAPYLELPMLMVRDVEDRTVPSIAYTRVDGRWRDLPSPQDSGLVACFRHGTGAHLLFQDELMTKQKDPERIHMAEGEGMPPMGDMPPKDEKEEGDGKMVSLASVVKALEAMVAMLKADEPEAKEEPATFEEPKPNNAPTPANVPGAAMKKQEDQSMTVEMAKISGELEAMRAKLAEREAADKRRSDVAEALKRLDGRSLGSDLETRLVAFHEKYGAEAFAAYVGEMVNTFALHSGDTRTNLAAGGGSIPEVALKYQAQGVDAVNSAARFAAEHDELARRNTMRVSRERYVEINMARLAAQN